jgi:hypothetical protein
MGTGLVCRDCSAGACAILQPSGVLRRNKRLRSERKMQLVGRFVSPAVPRSSCASPLASIIYRELRVDVRTQL